MCWYNPRRGRRRRAGPRILGQPIWSRAGGRPGWKARSQARTTGCTGRPATAGGAADRWRRPPPCPPAWRAAAITRLERLSPAWQLRQRRPGRPAGVDPGGDGHHLVPVDLAHGIGHRDRQVGVQPVVDDVAVLGEQRHQVHHRLGSGMSAAHAPCHRSPSIHDMMGTSNGRSPWAVTPSSRLSTGSSRSTAPGSRSWSIPSGSGASGAGANGGVGGSGRSGGGGGGPGKGTGPAN